MIPKSREETFLFLLALALPILYFSTLPWNIENSSMGMLDYYFNADNGRVLEDLRDSETANHYRDRVHPYFSLFAVSIAKIGGLFPAIGAEFLFYRLVFGTLGFFLFWHLIYRETDYLIAFSSTLLLMSTATVNVWSIIPETFVFGFFTLMLSLNLIRMQTGYGPVIIASLSGTLTNVFIGILYFCKKITFTRAFLLNVLKFAAVIVMLSLVQKMIYPTSMHFFNIFELQGERNFVSKSVSSIPYKIFDFIYSGFVIPYPDAASGVYVDKSTWVTLRKSGIEARVFWQDFFSHPFAGYVKRVTVGIYLTLVLIPVLLAFSLYRYVKNVQKSEIIQYVILFSGFQLLLHMFYGPTPFLYSFHFIPMIIIFIVLHLPRHIASVGVILAFAAVLQLVQAAQLDRFNAIFA